MSLDNPVTNFSATTSKPMSAVKSLVKFLDKVHGAVGEYSEDSNGAVNYMFFQDPSMKDIFNFYPDRICLDFIYKRFEIDLFIITFICEDSNGRNHIAAVGFLQKNDVESQVWLFNAFKKHNPNWRKIKSMFVDLGIMRETVRDSFQQPIMIISCYHAVKMFEKDLNNIEMNTFQEDNKSAAVGLFKRLVLASSISDFELFYQQFLLFPEPFVSYFLETWVPIQNEWRIPLDYCHENIFFNLNLFLEHYNSALESLLLCETSFIEFIKKLFLYISLKKKEKPSLFLQPVFFLYSRFSPEHQISKALTPYAAKFVIEQLDLSSEVYSDVNTLSSDFYTFEFMDVSVTASSATCSCNFFMLTRLPCRHIFAVRKLNYLCVFDESQIGYMWNMSYYEHTLACMQNYLTHNTDCRIPQDFQSRMALSSHLTEVTVQSLLEVPKEVFKDRLAVLKKLANAWEMEEDVSLLFTGIENRNQAKDINEPMHSVDTNPSIQELINEPSCSSKPDPSSSISTLSAGEDKESEHFRSSPVPVRSLRRPGLSDFGTTLLNCEPINIAYICCVICFTKESCVEWMKSKDLIQKSKQCPQCKAEMVSRTVLRLSDGVVWLCPKTGENKKGCGKRSSVRVGTWFEQINMTLEQLLIFTYLWVNKFSRKQIVGETGITSSLFVACDKFHRRVCEESLKNDIQTNSQCSKNLLERWLLKHENDDHFLLFLKEARRIHEEDATKCVVVEDKK